MIDSIPPLRLVSLCPPSALLQSAVRRSNFSSTPRRQQQQQQQQQQQNSANSMMQPPHGGHGQQDPLPSHCVSPMSQGGQGAGVTGQPVPDHHQVRLNALHHQVYSCVVVNKCSELLSFPTGPSQLGVLPEQPAEHEELIL